MSKHGATSRCPAWAGVGVLAALVHAAPAAANSIGLAGTSGQRASARELIRQFDAN